MLQGPVARKITNDPAMPASLRVSRQIARDLPGQRIALSVYDSDPSELGRLTLGLTWELTPRGFHAELNRTRLARELGDRYVYRGGPIPQVRVRVRLHGASVTVTSPRPPAAGSARASSLASRWPGRSPTICGQLVVRCGTVAARVSSHTAGSGQL